MFSLVEHIEYLMMSHDCVVVPGWGALIAQYSSSFYNEEAGVINKPQRKVGFNSSVNHNDGLLAQSIVRREGITYDEAVRFIAVSVQTFRQQLAEGNEVSLGRLGFFHNSDDRIDFIPFFHESRNDEYFGLRNVNFNTLAQMRAEQEEQEQEPQVAMVSPRSWARRAMHIAASIIVLLALVPVLTTPIINSNDKSLASLELPSVKPAPVETAVTDTVAKTEDVETEVVEVEAEAEVAEASQPSEEHRYHLVVCTMSTEAQAQAYVKRHNSADYPLQVLKRGSSYRIVVAAADDPTTLYKIKHNLPERFAKSWVGE